MLTEKELLKQVQEDIKKQERSYNNKMAKIGEQQKQQEFIEKILQLSKDDVLEFANYYMGAGTEEKKVIDQMLQEVISSKELVQKIKIDAKNMYFMNQANIRSIQQYAGAQATLESFGQQLQNYYLAGQVRAKLTPKLADISNQKKELEKFSQLFSIDGFQKEIQDITKFGEYVELLQITEEEKTKLVEMAFVSNNQVYQDKMTLGKKINSTEIFKKELPKSIQITGEALTGISKLLENPKVLKRIIIETGYGEFIHPGRKSADEKELIDEIKKEASGHLEEYMQEHPGLDPYSAFQQFYMSMKEETGVSVTEEDIVEVDAFALNHSDSSVLEEVIQQSEQNKARVSKMTDEDKEEVMNAIYSLKGLDPKDRRAFYDLKSTRALSNLFAYELGKIGTDIHEIAQLSSNEAEYQENIAPILEHAAFILNYQKEINQQVEKEISSEYTSNSLLPLLYLERSSGTYLEKDISADMYPRVKEQLDMIRSGECFTRDMDFKKTFKNLNEINAKVRVGNQVKLYYVPVENKAAIILKATTIGDSLADQDADNRVRNNRSELESMIDTIKLGGSHYEDAVKENQELENSLRYKMDRSLKSSRVTPVEQFIDAMVGQEENKTIVSTSIGRGK